MNKEILKFRTNSKLEKLVGRELITNNIIAIFELIKNSYDAGASEVDVKFENFTEYKMKLNGTKKVYIIDNSNVSRETVISNNKSKIILKDNGQGMSFEEIQKYWMEMGTVHKENIKKINVKSTHINKMHTRVLNGEKGIGRFGTDKLGEYLKLVAVDRTGTEKTTVYFNWNEFDNHSKLIQDVEVEYSIEQISGGSSGLKLEISVLRDQWTIKDVEELKMQLKKFVSPFFQEQSDFNIYVNTSYKEKIVNDSFEFTNTVIEASIDKEGIFEYTIKDNFQEVSKKMNVSKPVFGPVNLKILYMDTVSKRAFTRRTGLSTREYGNIKVFRDNFRIYPYGEPDNDWLGIDNKHAQAVFRSLGTRDIIGYVQISNIDNKGLRDATNRLGLVQDNMEFKEFKEFIWRCIELLESYIFNRIKEETQKQGKVIESKVIEVQANTDSLKKEILSVISKNNIPKAEAEGLMKIVNKNTKLLQNNIETVKKANDELSKKVKIYERIMGGEGILYDIMHVIKNKTALIQSQIFSLERQCKRSNISIDYDLMNQALKTINKLVFSALRKTSSTRLKKNIEILDEVIESAIEENKIYAKDKNIDIEYNFQDNYQRVFCNKESIKIVLDNLFNNSFKALQGEDTKRIVISTNANQNFVEIIYRDTGNGIKDEDAPFIFNVGFSNTKGSGLGLATSLDIMQDHGGDLSYIKISDNINGASFIIKVPIYYGGK